MEGQDVAVCDIPGAFLRAFLSEDVYMVMKGILADIMIQIAPDVYGPTATKKS